MENLYLFNTVEGVGKAHTYIEPRTGPAKLEDAGLTLVHPFYNEKARFQKQFEIWQGWSDYVRDRVNIVIVDDGSPNPVKDYIGPKMDKVLSEFNFSIYRIKQDLFRNTPGALNLGLTAAPTDWVLIMDSDCALDNENMKTLLGADPELNGIYHFPRKREGKRGDDLSNKRYLPCTKLFHRNVFMDKLGGFDEDFVGEYTGGWAFFDTNMDQCIFTLGLPFYIWNAVTAIEWLPSVVNGEILQRTPSEERLNRELYYKKCKEREDTGIIKNSTPILRFDWEKAYYKERK